jgi:hypothetical protein
MKSSVPILCLLLAGVGFSASKDACNLAGGSASSIASTASGVGDEAFFASRSAMGNPE